MAQLLVLNFELFTLILSQFVRCCLHIHKMCVQPQHTQSQIIQCRYVCTLSHDKDGVKTVVLIETSEAIIKVIFCAKVQPFLETYKCGIYLPGCCAIFGSICGLFFCFFFLVQT